MASLRRLPSPLVTLGVAAAIALALAALRQWGIRQPSAVFNGVGNPPASETAFRLTHLRPRSRLPSSFRTPCTTCHASPSAFPGERWHAVHQRSLLGQTGWEAAAGVAAQCGLCHPAPSPASLTHTNWVEVFHRMAEIRQIKGVQPLTEAQHVDLLHFYLTFSPTNAPRLAPEPALVTRVDHREVVPTPFGTPAAADSRIHPLLGNVRITDLDRDGRPDVILCDIESSQVAWVHRRAGSTNWVEESLAAVPHPTRSRPWTNSISGRTDLIVAAQSRIDPTDDPVGSVVWLQNQGSTGFVSKTLVEGLGRVAGVEPGDFNGDGRIDFLVAGFGYLRTGGIGWLENQGGDAWSYRPLVERTGAIDALPVDLDGDGRLDFVALFAQEHERISAFLNDGHGGFRERVLFEAGTPAYGSSGISLVDLDGDGDLDILYTNGDSMDLPTRIPRPFHGVQWLENRGDLRFEWHDIRRLYGAYTAVAVDLRGDRHPDLFVGTLFNDWEDPERASLLWFRNDGHQRFTGHALARVPTQLISLAAGSLENDGSLDLLATGMHGFPPFDRRGRVSRWRLVPQP